MLNLKEATEIINKKLPNGNIQSVIEYGSRYVFQVFFSSPLEGQYDPFYSVDMETGLFAEFSILTDGDPTEVTELFAEAERNKK